MFKINEIFYSIQGEGFWTGSPAIFVRFSGCNRKCDFCDTKHESHESMSIEEIVDKVEVFNVLVPVIFTGGEPLLQMNDEMTRLILSLKSRGFAVHIETNGTIMPTKLIQHICWITVSPKENAILFQGNELKLVYQNQSLDEYEEMDFSNFYLQPKSMENVLETVEMCKRRPKWKLSLQTQKLIDIA